MKPANPNANLLMPKRGANALMPSRGRKRPAPIENPKSGTPRVDSTPTESRTESPALGALNSLASKLKGGLLSKIAQKPTEEEVVEALGHSFHLIYKLNLKNSSKVSSLCRSENIYH